MKNLFTYFVFTICFMLPAASLLAQGGGVYTLAGGGVSTADGVPATSQQLLSPAGVCLDNYGNTYIADNSGNIVRRVDGAGLGYRIAGTGIAGFSGDGGAGNAAQLKGPTMLCTDVAGNVYIADAGNNRIRKVDASTGIITTVAGGGSSAADGIPATAASINAMSVCVDVSGNIYTGGVNTVRKIDAATGLIYTIAGNGVAIDTGDGGPAIAASINGAPRCLTLDRSGNLYIIASAGNTGPASMRIRKMDLATGNIITVAGGGSLTSEDILGVCTSLNDIYSCVVDAGGNIFVSDQGHHLIRRINGVSNIIHTIAGVGTSTADGTIAIYASTPNKYLAFDSTYIYFSLAGGNKVRRFSYYPLHGIAVTTSLYTNDSFWVSVAHLCSGPTITAHTHSTYGAATVKTWYGDASNDTWTIGSSCIGGDVTYSHIYANAGTYRLKHVLYHGSLAIDSIQYTYTHVNCNVMPVKIYYDIVPDCIKDNTESYSSKPVLVAVDSNGVAVDTISTTSGFYYDTYAPPGTVYSFTALPTTFFTYCPLSGMLRDTILPGTNSYPDKYLGLSVDTTGAVCDLQENAVVPVTGRNDQWGNIYVDNNWGAPANGTLTLNFSPKYIYTGGAQPTPASTSANTITWNLGPLSAGFRSPENIYFVLWANPATGALKPGDTVQNQIDFKPAVGDANPFNNFEIIIDTVRASCDPNQIFVAPSGCIASPADQKELKYTISFENTGTDTAFNVYIMDTLSDFVDLNSLRILHSPAVMNMEILKAGGHNIVKFDFPGINLLDTIHYRKDSCTAALIYTVNTRSGLADGASIKNHAGIYFDYNDPVMTNTVENIVGCPPVVSGPDRTATPAGSSSNIAVYPNPANDRLSIKTQLNTYTSFTITNSIGQVLIKQPVTGTLSNVDISTFPAGVYYISLKGAVGTTARKFVKM